MKTLTTMTAIAALIAGVSIAAAQNAPTTTANPSPNGVNTSNLPNNKSGNETQATAKKKSAPEKNMTEKMKSQTSGATPTSK